jgi:glycosyltransferase involved in cell wall biosynthesis
MISLVLAGLALFFTLLNSATMRILRTTNAKEIFETVAILIPMRNEESNAEGVLGSVYQQEFLSNLQIYVLDDQSTDSTLSILTKFRVSNPNNLEIISGANLPVDWLGKTHACQQLADQTKAKYLVFIDADVRLNPVAVSAAITSMNDYGWDFISPYPRQIAITWLEKFIQPLLQWSWLASVPLRLAQKLRIRSMTIANGQFLIVKRSAYEIAGGHSAIKNRVLDDLELARQLITTGFRGGVADASQIANCRMYSSSESLIAGYTKSLWCAFGGIPGTFLAIALLTWTGIFPLALGLSGYGIGWIAFVAIWISRLISAFRTRSSTATAFLHPISTLLLIGLIILSWVGKFRGELSWRGRILK